MIIVEKLENARKKRKRPFNYIVLAVYSCVTNYLKNHFIFTHNFVDLIMFGWIVCL